MDRLKKCNMRITQVALTGANNVRSHDTPTTSNQCDRIAALKSLREIAEGEFLMPIELGQRSVGWSAAEIDSWIEERIAKRGCHNDDV